MGDQGTHIAVHEALSRERITLTRAELDQLVVDAVQRVINDPDAARAVLRLDEELLGMEDMLDRLPGVSERTLRRLIKQEIIPAFQLPDRQGYFITRAGWCRALENLQANRGRRMRFKYQ